MSCGGSTCRTTSGGCCNMMAIMSRNVPISAHTYAYFAMARLSSGRSKASEGRINQSSSSVQYFGLKNSTFPPPPHPM